MKRYICVDCGQVFTGWAVEEICSKCGGKLELVIEEQLKGANKK
ncbi:hypothetical protein ES708_05301 [subsurface metagenome]